MLKVLHVDFKLLDGNEKNIFSLRATAQISESGKVRSNYEVYQQLMEKLKLKGTWNLTVDIIL